MYRSILAVLFAFLSLNSLHAMAANCSGGSIRFNTDPSDRGYWISSGSGYTPANNDPLLIMQVTIPDGMTCEPDYIENSTKKSQMLMRMTGVELVKTPQP